MDFSLKALRNFIVYFVLLLVATMLGDYHVNPQTALQFSPIKHLLLDAIYLHWVFSVRRRFPQKQLRRFITLFVSMFILLNLIVAAKYNFTENNGDMQRWLWYAYYTPFVFGPTFMFHASLYFGKPDDYRVSKNWYWLYLPPALIALGVLTNDFHQLAFRFNSGFAFWNDDYSHGIFYHMAAVWMLLTALGVMALALRFTFSRRLFKTAWLPLAFIVLAVLYRMDYSFIGNQMGLLQLFFEFSDFVCICSILVWECFVIARVVVSNKDYPAIFAASSLNAGLADRDFQVRQVSASGVSPSPGQLQAAMGGETLLPDGDTLLKARSVKGGWFYWTEDVAELRRLQQKLDETADFLTEENAMLRISGQIEEGQRKTEAQTKLYDRVTATLRPQLDTLDSLLRDLPADEEGFRRAMQTTAILVAYAKRRSNLLLLADARNALTGEEMGLCFEESVKALRMAGVPCELTVENDLQIPSDAADRLYELFETLVERALGALTNIEIALRKNSETLTECVFTLQTEADLLSPQELSALRQQFYSVSPSYKNGVVCLQVMVNNSKKSGGRDNDSYI